MSEQVALRNAASSYRPKGYGMSASLRRARRPFFFRNVITGVAIASFAVGVWAYSIGAVRQDVFDDVDEQARALNAQPIDLPPPGVDAAPRAPVTATVSRSGVAALSALEQTQVNRSKGLLIAALGDKYPWLFEPTHKTLVWGAPPIDCIGRIEDKRPVRWHK